MSLFTHKQRKQLAKLEHPPIAGEGDPPFAKGQVIEILRGLSLHVTMVNTRRGGGWSIRYDLLDKRDRPVYMRRRPVIHAADFDEIRDSFDEFGYPPEPTADVLEQAARESAYTHVPTPLGEAVDPRIVDEVNKRRREQRGTWQREKQQLVASLSRLSADRELQLAAAREIRALQRQLEALDRKLKGAA